MYIYIYIYKLIASVNYCSLTRYSMIVSDHLVRDSARYSRTLYLMWLYKLNFWQKSIF